MPSPSYNIQIDIQPGACGYISEVERIATFPSRAVETRRKSQKRLVFGLPLLLILAFGPGYGTFLEGGHGEYSWWECSRQ